MFCKMLFWCKWNACQVPVSSPQEPTCTTSSQSLVSRSCSARACVSERTRSSTSHTRTIVRLWRKRRSNASKWCPAHKHARYTYHGNVYCAVAMLTGLGSQIVLGKSLEKLCWTVGVTLLVTKSALQRLKKINLLSNKRFWSNRYIVAFFYVIKSVQFMWNYICIK